MNLDDHYQPSTTVGTLFASAVAKVRTEAEEAMAEEKAKSEAHAAEYADTIAQITTHAEKKAKAYAKTISRLKAQAKEQISRVRTQAEVKAAEYTATIARLKAQIKEKARTYTKSAGDVKPSTKIGALLRDAVAKQKAKLRAEAATEISKIRTEAEEKAAEYTATIARLKAQIEEKARRYTKSAGDIKPSTKIGALLRDAVAKQKAKSQAEAATEISRVRAEAEEKAAEYADTIARIKAQIEEKARMYTESAGEVKPSTRVGELLLDAVAKQKATSQTNAAAEISRIRAEAEEKAAEYADTIAKVKAEARDAITKVQTELEEAIAKQKPLVSTDTVLRIQAEENEVITDNRRESAAGGVSESIRRMRQSTPALADEHSLAALGTTFGRLLRNSVSTLCAKDIMQKELVWGSPDDSVQQTFTKMQQYDTGYMMIGHDGILEGIVSKSDITSAISPYLRPMFAKWRSPMDDATLQIRVKWVMSRPAHTITPQTSLVAVMKNMCRFRVLCLPVIGQQGKVQGLVAEVNILRALLKLKNAYASTSLRQQQSTETMENLAPALPMT
ncbi:MAG: CBS domain-containing protein [Planctomycetota bacterium]|jgi:predicted transcriptional regulator